VRLLGDISYPLYLVHIPVFILVVRYGLHNEYLMTGLSILVAFALCYCVDLYSRKREMTVKVPVSQPAA
jgi:peptidoglycan/LPS O-acetylase OafA/YrhL